LLGTRRLLRLNLHQRIPGIRSEQLLALLEQCQQRVYRIRRIDVEHQPMSVLANRREHKHLRRHLGLQLHDKPHHARLEAPGAKQLDVGIIASNLASEALKHAIQFDTFKIDDKTLGILDGELGKFDGCVAFQRHACVVGCRPDTNREHTRPGAASGLRQRRYEEDKGGSAGETE
jgi:hypothetical protein